MEKISITSTITTLSWASFFAYIWLNQESFIFLILLICIDFFTWLIKWNKKKNLKSNKMINWLLWKMVIIFIPLSIAMVWKINWLDMSNFLYFSFTLLSFAELYSIIANIYEIKTWEQVTEYDAVTIIIKIILKKIKTTLDNLTNTK